MVVRRPKRQNTPRFVARGGDPGAAGAEIRPFAETQGSAQSPKETLNCMDAISGGPSRGVDEAVDVDRAVELDADVVGGHVLGEPRDVAAPGDAGRDDQAFALLGLQGDGAAGAGVQLVVVDEAQAAGGDVAGMHEVCAVVGVGVFRRGEADNTAETRGQAGVSAVAGRVGFAAGEVGGVGAVVGNGAALDAFEDREPLLVRDPQPGGVGPAGQAVVEVFDRGMVGER